MRPLETLLLLANLLAFLALVVPPLRARPGMGYALPVARLMGGAQALVEGPRWQMIPAYALSGLFFPAWLIQGGAPAPRPKDRSEAERVGPRRGAGQLVSGTL